jgi:hypothetical protein
MEKPSDKQVRKERHTNRRRSDEANIYTHKNNKTLFPLFFFDESYVNGHFT